MRVAAKTRQCYSLGANPVSIRLSISPDILAWHTHVDLVFPACELLQLGECADLKENISNAAWKMIEIHVLNLKRQIRMIYTSPSPKILFAKSLLDRQARENLKFWRFP